VKARRLLLCGLALAGCNSNYQWPASMDRQPSVQPLAESRPPPAGSIPLGGLETLADREDDADLKPPVPFDAAVEARGRALFAIHCTACHGTEARGDGPVSARFPQAPNLRHVSICRRTDGFLYGTLAFVRSIQRDGCVGTLGPQDGVTP
jgi:hypothetical protein